MIVACHYRSCLFTSSTLYTRTISFFLIHKMKLSARFQREMVVLCLWLFFFFFFSLDFSANVDPRAFSENAPVVLNVKGSFQLNDL